VSCYTASLIRDGRLAGTFNADFDDLYGVHAFLT
jgi:hypothetical protein